MYNAETMKMFFGFILVISFSIACLIWRVLSNRHPIPCPAWLGWFVEKDNPFTKVTRASSIVQNADIQSGMAVLDVGCGPGRVTLPLAHKVTSQGKVVAMDIQQKMLSKVREKAQSQKVMNIEYFHSELGKNGLGKNKFDRVVLVSVLGEIPARLSALKEIYGALKSGGILSVTETVFDPHYQSGATVVKLGSTLGFREKERFGSWAAYTINFEKP